MSPILSVPWLLLTISQMRSFENTPLIQIWSGSGGHALLRRSQHLPIEPFERHPDYHPITNPDYITLKHRYRMRPSTAGYVCVDRVFEMDWRDAQRYWDDHDEEDDEFWTLDKRSTNAVVRRAQCFSGHHLYAPGVQCIFNRAETWSGRRHFVASWHIWRLLWFGMGVVTALVLCILVFLVGSLEMVLWLLYVPVRATRRHMGAWLVALVIRSPVIVPGVKAAHATY